LPAREFITESSLFTNQVRERTPHLASIFAMEEEAEGSRKRALFYGVCSQIDSRTLGHYGFVVTRETINEICHCCGISGAMLSDD
jgi:hypothetical protein